MVFFAGCRVTQDGSLQLIFEFPTPLYAEDAIASLAKDTRGILLSSCA